MDVHCQSSCAVGQPFRIVFEVNDNARNFTVPTMKGLTLISGPNQSHSSQTSFINGKSTHTVSSTFTIVVQGDAEGTANVGAAKCTVDGKTVSSKPFTVQIEKGDPNRAQNGGRSNNQGRNNQGWSQQQQQQQPATTIDNSTLFARATINKSTLYKGEEAIIIYKVYTQVPLAQFMIEKLPRIKGFWSEDLSENQTQVRQYSETLNGKTYQVAELRRGAIYPQETGKLTIEPLKTDVTAIVQMQSQRQRTGTPFDFFLDDFFDDPFFSSMRQQAVTKPLQTNSLQVNVKPLPEAPTGFNGAVGRFDIKSKSDITELRANEALTFSLTVSGRGNLSLLEAPQVDFPQGLEAYEPKIVDNINKGDNGLSGSRTFEWIVIPQTEGKYTLPGINYVYFDPSSGHYVTKTTEPIKIKVSKGVATTVARSDVKELNSDINYLKKTTKMHPQGTSGKASAWFWIIEVLILTATLTTILLTRRQQRINGNEESMRLQRATKLAKKRLRNAAQHIDDGKDNEFYEEIYKALWGGIADKFNIPQALLSADTVRRHLEEKQADPALIDTVMKTTNDVNFARFAPGDSSSTKRAIYDETMQTITQIASIKTTKRKSATGSMKAVVVLVAIAGTSMIGAAQTSNEELFTKANTAYDSGDYTGAVELYESIIASGVESSELYYNTGNAYYRTDNIGKAILNYERAYRLSPRDKQTKENLLLARSRTADHIEELPEFFLKQWFLAVVGMLTAKGWRVLLTVLTAVLCAVFCIFVISKQYSLRRSMFVATICVLALWLLTVVNTVTAGNMAQRHNAAIVVSPMVVVKGAPDAKSVDKFVLHEGTKMIITDTQDNWWQIEISDGKNGWIESGGERI